MSHELYEDVAPVAHVMTCDEMRARIAELAAERDAAIDARLTAERERAEALASVGERVANALMMRDRAADATTLRYLTGETAYLSRRVADLLGAGTYETVERALAEARREWAVVAGGAA